MTKAELIKYLSPFDDDIELLLGTPMALEDCEEIKELHYTTDYEGNGVVCIVPGREYDNE